MPLVRPGRALAGAALLLVACYDGDQLGFVPCRASDECDAPPRAAARRECLHAQALATEPGYCALPCNSPATCAGEAPGTAAQAAVCAGAEGENGGHCVLPCGAAEPCPSGMRCLSYAASATPRDCSDDATCVCFPDAGDDA